MNRIVKGKKAAARRPQGFTRSALCCAIAGGLLLAAAMPAAAQESSNGYEEQGQVGDPESWRTEEFLADWGLGLIRAEYAYARGLTGQGIQLGIFDSGSVLEHPELAGRGHNAIVIADPGCTNTTNLSGCFYSDGGVSAIDGYLIQTPGWVWGNGTPLRYEYNAHGTHVAGTMVANRNGDGGMHGVAFGANLSTSRLFFNTFSDVYIDPYGYVTNTVPYGDAGPGDAAIRSMYQQMADQGVRAINHSWGFTIQLDTAADMDWVYDALGSEFFRVYADGSLDTGMIQVWAAGNGGDDGVAGNGTGYYAGLTATLPRWVPELEPYWLSVANLSWDGELDESSNTCGLSMDWCITAPGTDVASSVVGGDIQGRVTANPDGSFDMEIIEENPEYGYDYYTGTSMAAPHVTGALALLMERYPYLDNTQVRDVMLTTATDLGTEGIDEIYGWGLLNLEDAINGPGQIRVDTNVVMDRPAGGAKVWEGDAWDDWSNDIGGTGRLTKSGIGWLRLSGDNSFGGLTVADGVLELTGRNSLGDTVVDGGLLLVNGVHTDPLTVNARGALGGSGTIGDTVVGGTVAPGNSIGTLHVAGDYTQAAGSYFDAELGLAGASDRIDVTGDANLLGGTVRVSGRPGEYLLGQSYTLLSAEGVVDGRFAGIDRSAFSPFLAFDVQYGADSFGLDVIRGMALADAAETRNQRAVATAADAMAVDDPLLARLVQLFPEEAVDAFDALSGEYHASVRSVLVDGSRTVRDAALARAQGPVRPVPAQGDGAEAWVQVFGTGGQLDGDGNAAALDYSGSGTLVGIEHDFGDGWRLGALGGVERSDLRLPARGSEGDVRSRHFGAYVGRDSGGFGLRAGAAHARQEVDSERTVAFTGVDQQLVAEYRASTTQAFVEGGYRFGGADWGVQPYLQYAHVQVETDCMSEAGGSAALTCGESDSSVGLATAGVRFDVGLRGSGQSASWLRWQSMLGWRHASGDTTPEARLAWRGGQEFTVAGAPVADGSMLVETGVGAWLGEDTLLELNYSGQFADESHDHGLNARLSYRF